MTKKTKIVIAVSSILAGLGISYFGIYKPLKASAQKKSDIQDAANAVAQAQASNNPDLPTLQKDYTAIVQTPSGFPLQYGSTDAKTGGAVTKLQNYLLNAYGSDVLGGNAATGKFLSYTDTAVRQNISADGKVTQDFYNNVINDSFVSSLISSLSPSS